MRISWWLLNMSHLKMHGKYNVKYVFGAEEKYRCIFLLLRVHHTVLFLFLLVFTDLLSDTKEIRPLTV
jgi:hypothetical protein